MIDDRRKPSSPPPARDESVEILATDNTISSARRRASRKLRVPNDQVPRRTEKPAPAAAPSDAQEAESQEYHGDTEISFGSSAPATEPGPVTEETNARLTDPSEPPSGLADATTEMAEESRESADETTEISVESADEEEEKPLPSVIVAANPPDEGIGMGRRVPRPSKPPPPAAAAPSPEPVAEEAVAVERPATNYSDPPPRVIDEQGVVRQVKRKIRSVGTGSVPPPPKRLEVVTESERPSAPPVAMERMEIAVPTGAAMSAGDDDFVVPPDESSALRAPPVPSISVPTADSEDVNVDDGPMLDAGSTNIEAEEAISDTEVLEDSSEEVAPPRRPERASSPDASAVRPPPPKPPPAPAAKAEVAAKSEQPVSRPTLAEPAAKKKRRPWWEEVSSDDYFRTMPKHSPSQTTTEGDFIEASLGVEKGAVVLDVACGDGRQAIELATRGYEMIALDLSLPMLSRAADTAQDRGAKLNFLHSDMREMEFNEMFDAAYCMNTSFGFFDDEKNIDVAQRIWRGLKTGGTFLLEVLNRDYAIASQPAMTWYEGDGCVCMEETSFNYITSRLVVKRTMIFDDGRQRENEYTIRLYALHELGTLLHDAGFRIVEVSGHARTPGAFFGNASRHLIILAQKKAAPSTETPSQPAPPGTET